MCVCACLCVCMCVFVRLCMCVCGRSSPWRRSSCCDLSKEDGEDVERARADAVDVMHRLRRHALRSLRGARPTGRVCLSMRMRMRCSTGAQQPAAPTIAR